LTFSFLFLPSLASLRASMACYRYNFTFTSTFTFTFTFTFSLPPGCMNIYFFIWLRTRWNA
jgi:hypothetical protein